MRTSRMIQTAQTLGEAINRVTAEAKGYKRLKMNTTTRELLYLYVFGTGENPFEEINQTRDKQLEKIEQDMINLIKSV